MYVRNCRPDWWDLKNRLSLKLLSFAAGGFLFAVIQVFTPFRFLDWWLLDTYQGLWPRAGAGNVMIVSLDRGSLEEFGAFPWRREVFATAIELIRRGGAQSIGLDVIFDASATGDPELRRAAGDDVVLATRLFDPVSRQLAFDLPRKVVPGVRLGFADVYTDDDGIHRRFLPRYEGSEGSFPSFAIALAGSDDTVEAPTSPRVVAAGGDWLERYPVVPIQELGKLSPEELRSLVRDRIVIVGATDLGLHDLVRTPGSSLSSGPWVPGVVFHADCVETILAGYPVRALPSGVLAVLALGLLVIGALAAGGAGPGPVPISHRVRDFGGVFVVLVLASGVIYTATGWYCQPLLLSAAVFAGFSGGKVAESRRQRNRKTTDVGAGPARRRLGRYEILEVLGEGAMGTVFLALDPKLEREVALKTVALKGATSGDEFHGLIREAITAAQFSHPNVVAIYDVGDEPFEAFIAMEYVSGGTLADLVGCIGGLNLSQIVALAAAVHRALEVAHERGVLHCDLKPGNILLGFDGSIKLSDFGIARALSSLAERSSKAFGTPGFIAPEVLLGEPVAIEADYFSLGVTLYEAATGELPFQGRNVRDVIDATLSGKYEPPLSLRPDMPAEMGELISGLLEGSPGQRAHFVRSFGERIHDLGDRYGSSWSGEIMRDVSLERPINRLHASLLATHQAPAR